MRQTLRLLWHPPYFRLFTFLLLLVAAGWFFYQTRVPWFIFLLSYTVAYLANPLVTWLQHHWILR